MHMIRLIIRSSPSGGDVRCLWGAAIAVLGPEHRRYSLGDAISWWLRPSHSIFTPSGASDPTWGSHCGPAIA